MIVRLVRGRYARSRNGTSVCACSVAATVASGAVTQPSLTQFSTRTGAGLGALRIDAWLAIPAGREDPVEGEVADATSLPVPCERLLGVRFATIMNRASGSKNSSPVDVRTVGSEVSFGRASFTDG